VSGLLDAINAAQGFIGAAGIGAFFFGWITAHTLGLTSAIAMFIAATAHTTDGVLGVKTGIVRVFERLRTGNNARPVAIMKIAMGLLTFALRFSGIIVFST
jgi:hypothetical protein